MCLTYPKLKDKFPPPAQGHSWNVLDGYLMLSPSPHPSTEMGIVPTQQAPICGFQSTDQARLQLLERCCELNKIRS